MIAKAFGANYAALAMETTKLVHVQRQARTADAKAQLLEDPAAQTENVRKMLLAFSRDLRVVMLRLASRLQTLRYFAASRQTCTASVGMRIAACVCAAGQPPGHLADQMGNGRPGLPFLEPETYKQTARLLDEKRAEREVSWKHCARNSNAS